jgi:hypothetical protein
MSEWHTHYPVQSGALRAQAVTTHTQPANGSTTNIEVAVRCEICGSVMEITGLADEDAALSEATRLLAEHAPQCSGPSEAV